MSEQTCEFDQYSLIGTGALGGALATSLSQAGVRLQVVSASTLSSAQDFVDRFGEGEAVSVSSARYAEHRPVLIAVPDDEMASVAAALAAASDAWEGIVVLHTSGALDSSVLAPLASKGAVVGSFHPIQTFTRFGANDSFKGITVGVEGDEEAIRYGLKLAEILVAEPVRLSAMQKILYHTAAVIAGNFAVTLLSIASDVWNEAVKSGADFNRSLAPLIRKSVENALEVGPENALSGPISRGDRDTLEKEFDALCDAIPQLVPVFASLSTETVHLATRSGTLSTDRAVELLDLIYDRLQKQENQG